MESPGSNRRPVPLAEPPGPDFAAVLRETGFARDPFPRFRALRERCPVAWSPGLGAWVVTGYDEARTALQDADRYSNRGRITGLFERSFTPAQQTALAPIIRHYASGLINVDPPQHTRLRKVLHAVFRPSVIVALAPKVAAAVAALLDRASTAEGFDFIRDFSHPLPVRVVCDLLGIPPADVPRLIGWSQRVVAFQQQTTPGFDLVHASQEALLELRAYLRERIAAARREGGEGVLALMAATVVDGDRLSEDEILGTAVTLINGGHETTTRFLANAIVTLHAAPAVRARLAATPAMMESAVEELLRLVGPFQRDGRVCRADTTLGGQALRAGDFVVILLGAANRDPRQFDAPDDLRPDRAPNKHLAFGYGPHICLGAPLARLEAAIALRAFLGRWPDYGLAPDRVEWDFGFVWGPVALPVALAG